MLQRNYKASSYRWSAGGFGCYNSSAAMRVTVYREPIRKCHAEPEMWGRHLFSASSGRTGVPAASLPGTLKQVFRGARRPRVHHTCPGMGVRSLYVNAHFTAFSRCIAMRERRSTRHFRVSRLRHDDSGVPVPLLLHVFQRRFCLVFGDVATNNDEKCAALRNDGAVDARGIQTAFQ